MNKLNRGLTYLASLPPWQGGGDFSLEPIRKVMERLGKPQDCVPCIHVAGTNGKGSVSATVAAILGDAGYRVGLNTSPHLQSIHERFVIDGKPVDDAFLGEFAYEIREAATRAGVVLSFHEVVTAISFLGFKELGLEWNIIEVGLGGLLDASNILARPAITAIVTIDYDHQHILGDTLEEIARHKAGIIKAGVPLVTGSIPPNALKVISTIAASKHAPHILYGDTYGIVSRDDNGKPASVFQIFSPERAGKQSFEITPGLNGAHQLHNAALSAAIGSTLGIAPTHCAKGIAGVFWPGRLERVVIGKREVVLDCAHNPAGIRSLVAAINSEGVSGIDLTFGVLQTKSWKEMLLLLLPYVNTLRLLKPDSPRAMETRDVRTFVEASSFDIRVIDYNADYERWMSELDSFDSSKTLFVAGSMYMVGRLRDLSGVPMRPLWNRSVPAQGELPPFSLLRRH